MERRNATPAQNTNFLRKTGALVVLLLILTVLCAYIAYTGFDVSSVAKHSVSPHRPAYGKKSKDKRHRHEKTPVIERSLLPRYSHLISADDNPLSQYYTVWNEETPQSVLKARGDRRKILVWEQWRTLAVLPRQACPSMPQCEFTLDRGQIAEADGVVFWFRLLPFVYDRSYFPTVRPAHQHWIMRSGDCPYLTRAIDWVSYSGVFNWTMTYRNDSDVYIPYDDFKSPRALASYLMYLDKNEDKYMEYFAWRNNPPKNLPDYESHWCELCKMLVQAKPTERKVYNDIDKWWRGPNYEFSYGYTTC
ncbi:Alpha-(1,3)-fucosyltransferase 7 [Branchiostoma belcheri]|nr:Alpha-(1,3)-fucosyltransferase 7 [Branchiostoma belcheri]